MKINLEHYARTTITHAGLDADYGEPYLRCHYQRWGNAPAGTWHCDNAFLLYDARGWAKHHRINTVMRYYNV